MTKKLTTVNKREFVQNTSRYMKLAEHGENVVITHHNKPALRIEAIEKKTWRDLRGMAGKIVIKGDINEPVLGDIDTWLS